MGEVYKKHDSWECQRCGMIVVSKPTHDKYHKHQDEIGNPNPDLTKEAQESSGRGPFLSGDAATRPGILRSDGEWPR